MYKQALFYFFCLLSSRRWTKLCENDWAVMQLTEQNRDTNISNLATKSIHFNYLDGASFLSANMVVKPYLI
jgi:hypothetical protein